MFKRTRLFSLLFIIVASTIIGLFGFSRPVSAVDQGCENKDESVINFVGDSGNNAGSGGYSPQLCYKGNIYANSGTAAVLGKDTGFSDSSCNKAPLVYLHLTEDGKGAHIICFTKSGTQATFIYFPYGSVKPVNVFDPCVVTPPQGKSCVRSGDPPVTVTVNGEPVDITDAQKQFEEEQKIIDKNKETLDAPQSTCQISGIGWLVCPILSFLGGLADGVYYILDTVFLRLPPVNMDLNDTTNGMYLSWKLMRDVANIVFVIAFLIIVFSQITSIGISNYGLKRLVPKLIMAAILVNVSYFICAAAVDVSNILGTSLKSLLDGASKGILQPETATVSNSGGFWQGIITGVLVISFVGAAALAGFATLSLAIGALLFVVPIVVTVLITMIVRQALVVLLIVISPLAFVALLLPNTESYYKKWLELFKAMLIMYPVIAVMFGASSLASTVLMAAAKDAGDLQVLHQIAGGAVRVLPLIFIPALMKISSGVFGRITGMANDKQKGWFDAKRNANADRGKIQRANRVSGIGKWVREDPSKRRRGLAAMTAYGSSNRELRRKDALTKATSDTEKAYLGETKNQNARNDAKNAQINLQNAQLQAETLRINGTEARNLQTESTELEKRKKTAEDNSQAAALSSLARDVISGQGVLAEEKNAEVRLHTATNQAQTVAFNKVDHALETQAKNTDLIKETAENESKTFTLDHASQELKVGAEVSSQKLTNSQSRDKQIYTEVAAANRADPKTAAFLAAQGIRTSTANAAKDSSDESKAIASATSTAVSEGESNYSTAIQAAGPNPLLDRASGNINPKRGGSRALGRASEVEIRDESEAVENSTARMSRTPIPKLLSIAEGTAGETVEDRTGAMRQLVKRGSDEQVIQVLNTLAAAPDDDDGDTKTMQQFVFAEIASHRPQMALSATDMSDGKAGVYHPDTSSLSRRRDSTGKIIPGVDGSLTDTAMDASMRARLIKGKFNAISVLKGPSGQANHMLDVLENGADRATVIANPNFIQFQNDVISYLSGIDDLPASERPTPEMLDKLQRIAAIY